MSVAIFCDVCRRHNKNDEMKLHKFYVLCSVQHQFLIEMAFSLSLSLHPSLEVHKLNWTINDLVSIRAQYSLASANIVVKLSNWFCIYFLWMRKQNFRQQFMPCEIVNCFGWHTVGLDEQVEFAPYITCSGNDSF